MNLKSNNKIEEIIVNKSINKMNNNLEIKTIISISHNIPQDKINTNKYKKMNNNSEMK